MSTQDALPGWLRTVFIAINDAPWTNVKSMNTEILTYGTAFFLVIAAVKQVSIEENILYAWLAFLMGKVTASVAGSGIKRATYKPSPPNTQDIEDTAATTATPSPVAPFLTKADADTAAHALEEKQREIRAAGAEAVG